MRVTHELKTWPEFFGPIMARRKKFELRQADRAFQVDDLLKLREWDPATEKYTGRFTTRTVLFLMRGPDFGLGPHTVAMSISDEEAA